MSTALKSSITKLDQAVNKLESVIQQKAQTPKAASGVETDLFGVPVANSNDGNIDTKALASKLDSVIDKVEKILQEG